MRGVGALILLTVVLAAGCGGGEEPARHVAKPSATPAPARKGLLGALAAVKAGEAGHKAFAWSDVGTLRQIAGYPERSADLRLDNLKARWLQALAAGGDAASSDNSMWVKLAERLGFDYLQAESAISIGDPPHRAARLDGLDAARVATAARRLGAREVQSHGRTILARRSEGKMDIDDPLTEAGILAGANRISAKGQTVAMGAFDQEVDEILGGGRSLADEAEYEAAAACLGDDALFAEIYPTSVVHAAGTLVAIGARAVGDEAEEIACEVGVPPADADRHVAALRKRLGPGAKTPDGFPIRKVGTLSEATSGTAAGRTWVRAKLRPAGGGPVSFFINELQRQALTYYFAD